MGRIEISLLGAPEIRHAGELIAFPTRKTQALLIYLAVEGGTHRRDKLTTLFWPDSDDELGRRSLRTALASLRRVLDETLDDERRPPRASALHLIVDRESLGFTADAAVDLDLAHVENGSRLARGPLPARPEEQLAGLRQAASRYRGDFLEGFSLDDAPAFDDWVSVQRETWHRRADLIFDRLSRILSEGGERLDAIDVTARWVAMDPLNEVAHRRLIQLYAAAGDRTAALRAYNACRTILAQELSADPAPETEALAVRVRAEAPVEVEPSIFESVIPSFVVEAPLVGRSTEHAQLVAALRSARRGKTQVITIEGEPGIGKSRLASEFLRWAAAQGADVLKGRAFEAGGDLPYQLVVEALRGRLDREDQSAPTSMDPRKPPLLDDVWLAELSRILPELRARARALPAPLVAGESEARTRLFEAVARVGQRLAARAPLVCFVDDVQWADASSLDLLQYVARRWAADGSRVLIIVGVRSDDLSANSRLATWIGSLTRDLPVARITLGPLTADDTLRIVQGLGMRDTPSPFADWLFAETTGHPLYIVETLKAIWERGLITRDEAGAWTIRSWESTRAGTEQPGLLPEGIQSLIHGRFARLSAPAREALAAASVVGDGFEADVLGPVAGLSDQEIVEGLEDLLARRLVREMGDRYLFWHDKIREVAAVEMGEARRRLYHRRALQSLVERQAPAARLARHARAAGLAEPSFRYSVAAGDAAMRLFAARDAISHYEAALQIGGDVQQLYHLYLQLGRAFELTNEYARARSTYEALLASARRLGDQFAECRGLNRLADLEATERLDLRAQVELLHSALAIAEASGDGVGQVETEWNLARSSFYRMDLESSRSYTERALARARALGLMDQVARCLNLLALTEPPSGRWRAARAHAEEACALFATLGDRAMEADSLVQLAWTSGGLGQVATALAAAWTARQIVVEIDNAAGLGAVTLGLVQALLDQGDYVAALAAGEEGVAAARTAAFPPPLFMDLLLLGIVNRRLGKRDAAVALHNEALGLAQRINWVAFVDAAAAELCVDYAEAGDWVRAVEYARQARAARAFPGHLGGWSRWYETEALIRAGDAVAAADDVRQFGERIGDSRRLRVSFLRASSVVAEGNRDVDAAIAFIHAARDLAAEIGLPGELWEIHARLATLHRQRGEEREARENATRASEIVESLGSKIHDDELQNAFLVANRMREL